MATNVNAIGFWQGPPAWLLVLLLVVGGGASLAISLMAINGIPDSLSWRKSKLPVNGRTVVITGGSQGMGRELGNVLSFKGANVVLVARSSAKLEKAVDYISKAAPNPETQRFHWISADVTSPEENERMMKEVIEWNHGNPPDIVWANAGAAVPGYFLDASVETLRGQMDLNYWAAVYLARTTLKAWLKTEAKPSSSTSSSTRPPPRHFIMTSSVAAFVGLAGYAAYAPSKSALRSFHDQLRSELNLYNGYLAHPRNKTVPKIKVHTVFPGTILSPGLDKENETKPDVLKMLEDGDPKQTPLEVAQRCIRELEKGKSLVVTNFLGSMMRGSSMMGSIRDSWFMDSVYAGLANMAWLFIAPDMEKKIQKWGREHGMPLHED